MEENLDLDKLFREAKGDPVVVRGRSLLRIVRFKLPAKKMILKFCFIEANSEWRQGFILKTKGTFKTNDLQIDNAIVLWEDTAPKNFEVSVDSKDGTLLIYNVWDFGDGVTQAWHNGAAMDIDDVAVNKHVYNCNDGHPDFDFKDLIFSMEWN